MWCILCEVERDKNMKVLIVGAGKLGCKLTSSLINIDADITVMDDDSSVLESLSDTYDILPVKGSGIDLLTLQRISIETFDLTIGVTENDETNIVTCTLAKKLGCKKVIARIRSAKYMGQHEFIKESMNIDFIINPENSISEEIKNYLHKDYPFYSHSFASDRISIITICSDDKKDWIGQKLFDISDLDNYLIVAISKNGKIIIPNGHTSIEEGSMLYVIGKSDEVLSLAKDSSKKTKHLVKNTIIVGGGKIGFYLASLLSNIGIDVKLIEILEKRCDFLSENLSDDILILNSDGTNMDFLQEEDIENTDAIICVTDYDEANILTAAAAKKLGVTKAIAKTSKTNYTSIIDDLTIDVVIRTIDIAAADILKYLGGNQMLSLSMLLGGEAEVLELIVDETMHITKKPLKNLDFPKGIIIGSILRNNSVIIPNGGVQIQPEDKIVIFCIKNQAHHLKNYLESKKGGKTNAFWLGD